MTALKAHEVSRYLQKPDLAQGIFLAFGPDQGLVRETGQQLMRHYAGPDADPMAQITLDVNDIADEPGLLAVEARTIPMFGGARRIRVRGATKKLTNILVELFEDMPDCIIILEAGNLPPRDSLRALIEKQAQGRTLPCYADDSKAISALIQQTFADAKIQIEPEAINALKDNLGNDREITRRELEKLSLYALESKTLTIDDITTLCGDNASLVIDQILDSAGNGRLDQLDDALARAVAAATDPQRLLISALLHFTWLRRLRAEVDNGKAPRMVLDAQKPRPHFSRKPALEQQLRLWSDAHLASASARIYTAIAQSRKNSSLVPTIAHRALLAIAVAAAHH